MLAPRLIIYLIFALHGAGMGSLFSRIADIRTDLGLSEAELGFAIVGLPVGVLVGAQLVSDMIERFDTRRVLILFFTVSAAIPFLTSLATGPITLFIVFSAFGLAFALCNITMNVEADRIEAATGARILNRCHGMWGVGFLIASMAGSGFVFFDISTKWHFLCHMVFIWLCIATLISRLKPSPPRDVRQKSKRFAPPSKGAVLILGFIAASIVLEGAARNWSVIYMRDVTGARDDLATLALSAFIAFQTLGRFLADAWIEKSGPQKTAQYLSLAALAGLIIVIANLTPLLVLFGFALIGFGVATSFPQAMSAAARLPGERSASENVAALTTLTTFMNFVTPPFIGFVATRYGLQLSLALVLPLPILAVYMARYLVVENTPQ